MLGGDNQGWPNGRRLERRRDRHRRAGSRRLPQGQRSCRSATASTRDDAPAWARSRTSPTRTRASPTPRASSVRSSPAAGPVRTGPARRPNQHDLSTARRKEQGDEVGKGRACRSTRAHGGGSRHLRPREGERAARRRGVQPPRGADDRRRPVSRQHRRLRVPQPGPPEHGHAARALRPAAGACRRAELRPVR